MIHTVYIDANHEGIFNFEVPQQCVDEYLDDRYAARVAAEWMDRIDLSHVTHAQMKEYLLDYCDWEGVDLDDPYTCKETFLSVAIGEVAYKK